MATTTRTFITPFHLLGIRATRTHHHARPSIDPAHLWQACARVTAETERETCLRVLVEETRQLARADAVSVMLPLPHTAEFHIAHSFGLPAATVRQARAPFGESIAGWVYERKQGLVLHSPMPDLHHAEPNARKRRTASAISVPLYSETIAMETPIGVLNVSRRREPFADRDLPLLQKFASQAAVALRNLMLYDEMQIRTRWLSNLIDISHHLTGELKLDVLLQRVVEKALDLLGCEAGSLLLVDEPTGDLIFKIALGPAGKQLLNTRLPRGMGIAGAVTRTGQPQIVQDAGADTRHHRATDSQTGFHTRSLIAVPLVNKGRTVGVIELLNKRGGRFDAHDVERLTSFSTIAAIALENARLYRDLEDSFTDIIRVILNAVEARDGYTRGHIGRVTHLAREVARELGLGDDKMQLMEWGSLLHDIGKIGVSDVVLNKPGQLTHDEYEHMKKHPVVGAKMVEGVKFLQPVVPTILHHQEKWDGTGYPRGLRGEEIPIEARIISVVDTFDALTSDRPYRRGTNAEHALAEIARNSGTQFDPRVVRALERLWQRGRLSPRENENHDDA